jgi:hypothetical protein
MVLPDLQQLVASAEAVERWNPRRRVGGPPLSAAHGNLLLERERSRRAVGYLKERRPTLFALHTPVIGQLSDIDPRLYGHLFQCQTAHRRFEDGMIALSDVRDRTPDAGQLYEDWQRCAVHARLASYFLDRFVLAGWPRWWHRFRMMVRPNSLEVESRRLLRTAAVFSKPPRPDSPRTGART